METKRNIKKIIGGVMAVFTVGIIATAGLASAYQGNPGEQGPNFDADLHDLKVDAFDSGDFDIWKDLMEQQENSGRVLDVVNAENFNQFVEAHNAALEGDFEVANQLRSELGLNDGVGPKDGSGHKGGGQGKGQGQGQNRMNSGSQIDFVDNNGDGVCDNEGTNSQQKRNGKGRH